HEADAVGVLNKDNQMSLLQSRASDLDTVARQSLETLREGEREGEGSEAETQQDRERERDRAADTQSRNPSFPRPSPSPLRAVHTLDDSLEADDTPEAGMEGGPQASGAGTTGSKPPLPTPPAATGFAAAVSALSGTAVHTAPDTTADTTTSGSGAPGTGAGSGAPTPEAEPVAETSSLANRLRQARGSRRTSTRGSGSRSSVRRRASTAQS
ncbi:hypothetical protein KIPB_010268, partial [Kipferlia bialata]